MPPRETTPTASSSPFGPRYPLDESPVYRALWFAARDPSVLQAFEVDATHHRADNSGDASPDDTLRDMLNLLEELRRTESLFDQRGKLREDVFEQLGRCGYWGLRVPSAYGGRGMPFRHFVGLVTRVAQVNPTLAALASVHGSLGPPGAVAAFGTEEQKQRFLPDLASGKRLGIFGLTEPGAGTNLAAIRTRAERHGERFLVTGEKLFITNAAAGRVLALVCRIDDRPQMLLCQLPEHENEQFQLRQYGLHAARRGENCGIVLREFPVPVENLLQVEGGNGLTIAYYGLNRGRVGLAATAAGSLRVMLAGMLPWVRYRRTHGQPIGSRELVQRRIARAASLIVGCDRLVAWASSLIDAGYRGEMEAIVAKVFASEAQKEMAVELALRTHGGRSFLHGHPLGDSLHDQLAPCVYEGENEMLSLGLFRAVLKPQVAKGFADFSAGPSRSTQGHGGEIDHIAYARRELASLAAEIMQLVRKYGLELADRQLRVAELSGRLQQLIVLLVTSCTSTDESSEALSKQAAACLASQLRRELEGRRASDEELAAEAALGAAIVENGGSLLEAVEPPPVMIPYDE